MSDKINTIMSEQEILGVMQQMTGTPSAGTPEVEPDYTIRAWFINPYWYVVTSDGITRVTSDDKVRNDEDLVWSVGEQIRILRLPQYRKELDRE